MKSIFFCGFKFSFMGFKGNLTLLIVVSVSSIMLKYLMLLFLVLESLLNQVSYCKMKSFFSHSNFPLMFFKSNFSLLGMIYSLISMSGIVFNYLMFLFLGLESFLNWVFYCKMKFFFSHSNFPLVSFKSSFSPLSMIYSLISMSGIVLNYLMFLFLVLEFLFNRVIFLKLKTLESNFSLVSFKSNFPLLSMIYKLIFMSGIVFNYLMFLFLVLESPLNWALKGGASFFLSFNFFDAVWSSFPLLSMIYSLISMSGIVFNYLMFLFLGLESLLNWALKGGASFFFSFNFSDAVWSSFPLLSMIYSLISMSGIVFNYLMFLF